MQVSRYRPDGNDPDYSFNPGCVCSCAANLAAQEQRAVDHSPLLGKLKERDIIRVLFAPEQKLVRCPSFVSPFV